MKKICQEASGEFGRYERSCAEIRKENTALLKEFAQRMRQQGLSDRTIGMHLANVGFYIQEFLLYEQPLRPTEGASSIGMYLGYWFIRKGPIATPGTIKTSATSLIKFYSFLVDKGVVASEQLVQMRQTVKTDMAHWQERARRYNNPAIDDPSEIWI